MLEDHDSKQSPDSKHDSKKGLIFSTDTFFELVPRPILCASFKDKIVDISSSDIENYPMPLLRIPTTAYGRQIIITAKS